MRVLRKEVASARVSPWKKPAESQREVCFVWRVGYQSLTASVGSGDIRCLERGNKRREEMASGSTTRTMTQIMQVENKNLENSRKKKNGEIRPIYTLADTSNEEF